VVNANYLFLESESTFGEEGGAARNHLPDEAVLVALDSVAFNGHHIGGCDGLLVNDTVMAESN
jgi:hypothetical protein